MCILYPPWSALCCSNLTVGSQIQNLVTKVADKFSLSSSDVKWGIFFLAVTCN
jgi:hypothetical protein